MCHSSLPEFRHNIDCGLLRHLAAFLILLVWTKLSVVVSSHPAFPCHRYLPMLAKVTLEHIRVVEYYLSKVIKTSIPVMGFFSLFIGGFSMAFYIILQQVK